MSWEFKAEDFEVMRDISLTQSDLEWLADIANRKLKEWLSEAPIVSGTQLRGAREKGELPRGWVREEPNYIDTHTARLADIQPFKGSKC